MFKDLSDLDIKNLGVAMQVLGIGMVQTDDGTKLGQQAIAEKYSLANSAPTRVPIATNYESTGGEQDAMLPTGGKPSVRDYQSLVSSLLWIHRCTRPHIGFAVHRLTRKTHAPTTGDWATAKRLVRYLLAPRKLACT